MNNQNNKILTMLISLSVVAAIAIIFIMVNQANIKENDSNQVAQTSYTTSPTAINTETADTTTNKNNTSLQTSSNNDDASTTLAIVTSRCSGCGKCAQIDPEHFNVTGRTATVISQDNLTSSTLERAIEMCHNNAINLS